MCKLIVIFNIILSSFTSFYVSVDYIDCYSNYEEKITFDFSFISDSISSHELFVNIDIYDIYNKKIVGYSNNIMIIGNKKISAKIDYLYKEDIYALINVLYEGEKIVSNIRFDFYKSSSCTLDKYETTCNSFYKNSYKDNSVVDKYMNIQILNGAFDSFLIYNKLDLSSFYIYSEYDFSESETYLLIEEKIDEYKMGYEDGYKIFLSVIKDDNYYTFKPLETYYLSVHPFGFSDQYKENFHKTNYIYFPFFEEYKEYSLKIIIYKINRIEINFTISTSDGLFGECEKSKYCMERISYD